MSEAQNPVETVLPRPVLLRTGREAAGLHIAALAAALKVPVRKLEALEAGRYDELPDLTFARALASSACRHLKIDPAPILAEIPQGAFPELGGSRPAINAPFKPASDPAPVSPLSWLSRPALLTAIALLLGALVIVFLPRAQEPAQELAGTDTVAEPVEPLVSLEPEAPSQAPPPEAAGNEAPPAAATETAPLAAADPAPPAAPVQAAPATTPPPASVPRTSGTLMTITATGESWVEVTNGQGAVVTQRVLRPGDAIDFSSSPPYSVVLGRADAAQVTVRGRPLELSGFVRNNVARFEVK